MEGYHMKKTGMNKLYTGLLLCMAGAGLTACGSSDGTTKTSGRLTAISETQIQIEEMTGDPGQNGPASGGAIGKGRPASGPAIQGDDKKKGPFSGGAVGVKPDGTRRKVKDRILPSLREKARLTRLTVIQRSTRKTVEKRPRFPWMR